MHISKLLCAFVGISLGVVGLVSAAAIVTDTSIANEYQLSTTVQSNLLSDNTSAPCPNATNTIALSTSVDYPVIAQASSVAMAQFPVYSSNCNATFDGLKCCGTTNNSNDFFLCPSDLSCGGDGKNSWCCPEGQPDCTMTKDCTVNNGGCPDDYTCRIQNGNPTCFANDGSFPEPLDCTDIESTNADTTDSSIQKRAKLCARQRPPANFEKVCQDFRIERKGTDWTLNAACQHNGGDIIDRTTLSLNRCITNDGGQLKWQKNGGFSASCYSCFFNNKFIFTKSVIECACYSKDKRLYRSVLYLGQEIGDNNGALVCDRL